MRNLIRSIALALLVSSPSLEAEERDSEAVLAGNFLLKEIMGLARGATEPSQKIGHSRYCSVVWSATELLSAYKFLRMSYEDLVDPAELEASVSQLEIIHCGRTRYDFGKNGIVFVSPSSYMLRNEVLDLGPIEENPEANEAGRFLISEINSYFNKPPSEDRAEQCLVSKGIAALASSYYILENRYKGIPLSDDLRSSLSAGPVKACDPIALALTSLMDGYMGGADVILHYKAMEEMLEGLITVEPKGLKSTPSKLHIQGIYIVAPPAKTSAEKG